MIKGTVDEARLVAPLETAGPLFDVAGDSVNNRLVDSRLRDDELEDDVIFVLSDDLGTPPLLLSVSRDW